jgi:hypothetical protein
MIPTIKQYRRWSKPSKYTFWSFLVGLVSLGLTTLQIGKFHDSSIKEDSLMQMGGIHNAINREASLTIKQPVMSIQIPKISDRVKHGLRQHIDKLALRDEIELSILTAQKFQMVTRMRSDLDYMREQHVIAKSSLVFANTGSTRKIEKADYLILPVVRNMELRTGAKGTNPANKMAILGVSAKIIEVTSGSIIVSYYLKSIVAIKGDYPTPLEFNQLAKGIAHDLVDQVIESVFPMKVINRHQNDSIVVINRGNDGGLRVGEILNAFFRGETLVDPDTRKDLGHVENFVGKVRVTRVNPSISYGEITDEQYNGSQRIGVGTILRKGS